MKIYIPYTKLLNATLISLVGYDFETVKVEGDYGYSKFFQDRWREGQGFINVEHDCVIWPGAIEALNNCEQPWCVYDYSLPVHRQRSLEAETVGIPLGCMKISAEMIKEIPDCWSQPVKWDMCDQQLTKYALFCGLKVHQHFPGIVNANNALVALAKGQYESEY